MTTIIFKKYNQDLITSSLKARKFIMFKTKASSTAQY